jgi:alpha-ketoglutarate-dependent dioxygenase FTO
VNEANKAMRGAVIFSVIASEERNMFNVSRRKRMRKRKADLSLPDLNLIPRELRWRQFSPGPSIHQHRTASFCLSCCCCFFSQKPDTSLNYIHHSKRMGGSKQRKKQKRKRAQNKPSNATSSPPQSKKQHQQQQDLSLASRLKKARGTADSTPLPPEWSGQTTKSFLSPNDGETFEQCRRECYRGFTWQEANELEDSFHQSFDECFDTLYKTGLFLYDAVQPGGKRLSKTFVTRTVIGKPGSTYRYLGLRLFSHPWCSENADTTTTDIQSLIKLGYSQECAAALVTMKRLNASLKDSTQQVLDKEIAPHVPLPGSADYSLTLINRMEPTSLKKDLKHDKDYGMGKTSVSWHKDSGLMDFSSIAVYHSLREMEKVNSNNNKDDVPWKVAVRVADKECKTPPLCVPLPSGTLYYLLDDFNHQHEHTVVAGSNKLRYSSTHRVAREGRGTWQYIHDKCKAVLESAKDLQPNDSGSLSERRKRRVKTTRAQQQLLDEIEFEWLRQWYIQGKLHARLHPYWHKPIEQLEECFVELERHTLATIELLRASSKKKSKKESTQQQRQEQDAASLVNEDLFDVLIESMEEREKTRAVWLERLDDPIFETMSDEEKPFASQVLI